ncbi:MAG: tetratricopeptide repeat protein [Elusimicrobiota bacterium]
MGWKWVGIGLIIICTTVIYYASFQAPFILDDKSKIVNNPDIKKLNNIKTKLIYPYRNTNYTERNDPSRPLVYLTFTLNYFFGRLNPFGYHLVNFIFHIFNAILLFLLTKKIMIFLSLRGETEAIPKTEIIRYAQNDKLEYNQYFLPFLVTSLFAIHPVNTSAVSYIFSRSVGLSVFFYLLALLFFIEHQSLISYLLSLICFILALFSRQDAVTLPAIILVFDYIFLKSQNSRATEHETHVADEVEAPGSRPFSPLRASGSAGAETSATNAADGLKPRLQRHFSIAGYHIPYWIILVLFLLFRYFYFGKLGDLEAPAPIDAFIYFINQPYSILRYIGLLIIPAGICLDRGSLCPVTTLLDTRFVMPVIIVIGLLLIAVMLYQNKQPASKLISFAVLWFFITLSPTSSIFPTTSVMVDNRLYISGFGVYLILVYFYLGIIRRLKYKWLPVVPVFYFLFLGIITYKRNQLFANPVLLWQDTIKKSPYNIRPYNNLGFLYYEQKKYVQAINILKRAIFLKPDHTKAHNNLGIAYLAIKQYENAKKEFQEIIKLNPDNWEAHSNLGLLYFELKQYKESFKEYKKAISLSPICADTYNNLGILYFTLEKYEDAKKQFKKAIEINPDHWQARSNLAKLYSLQKKKL